MTVTASSASLTNSLLSVKRYKPNWYGFAGNTYGQQQSSITSSAAQAGIKLLNNYANTTNNWEEVPNGNFPGTYHISRYRSYYNGVRVECPYHYSCINISAEFVTTDGGNGAVYGWKVTDEQWLKTFTVVGGGGDDGHYGEGQLRVTLTVPGISGSITHVSTYAIWSN